MYFPGDYGIAVPRMRSIPIDSCGRARRSGCEPFLSPARTADPRLYLPSILMSPGINRDSKVVDSPRQVRQVPQSEHNCSRHSFWAELDLHPPLNSKKIAILKKRRILIDVFINEGKYIYNFYLDLNGSLKATYVDSIFVKEKDEEENLQIVEYKIIE